MSGGLGRAGAGRDRCWALEWCMMRGVIPKQDCPEDMALGLAMGEIPTHFCQVMAYIPSIVLINNDISQTNNMQRHIREEQRCSRTLNRSASSQLMSSC